MRTQVAASRSKAVSVQTRLALGDATLYLFRHLRFQGFATGRNEGLYYKASHPLWLLCMCLLHWWTHVGRGAESGSNGSSKVSRAGCEV